MARPDQHRPPTAGSAGTSLAAATRAAALATAGAAAGGAAAPAHAGGAGVAGLGTTAPAAYFTRRVLTPDHVKADDVMVFDVDHAAPPPTATLGGPQATA